jgi:hypothetical protein
MVFDIDVIQHHATPSASSGRFRKRSFYLKRNGNVPFRLTNYAFGDGGQGARRSQKRELFAWLPIPFNPGGSTTTGSPLPFQGMNLNGTEMFRFTLYPRRSWR